jgi:hypothetical protein
MSYAPRFTGVDVIIACVIIGFCGWATIELASCALSFVHVLLGGAG